jgi:hypothetical protein
LSHYGILWLTKERKDGSIEKTKDVSRFYSFLNITGMLISKLTPYNQLKTNLWQSLKPLE